MIVNLVTDTHTIRCRCGGLVTMSTEEYEAGRRSCIGCSARDNVIPTPRAPIAPVPFISQTDYAALQSRLADAQTENRQLRAALKAAAGKVI